MFLDEIAAATARYPGFRSHITISERDGSLTMEQIVARSTGPMAEKDIYICGPARMIAAFQSKLHKVGVPSNRVHFERFDFR